MARRPTNTTSPATSQRATAAIPSLTTIVGDDGFRLTTIPMFDGRTAIMREPGGAEESLLADYLDVQGSDNILDLNRYIHACLQSIDGKPVPWEAYKLLHSPERLWLLRCNRIATLGPVVKFLFGCRNAKCTDDMEATVDLTESVIIPPDYAAVEQESPIGAIKLFKQSLDAELAIMDMTKGQDLYRPRVESIGADPWKGMAKYRSADLAHVRAQIDILDGALGLMHIVKCGSCNRQIQINILAVMDFFGLGATLQPGVA